MGDINVLQVEKQLTQKFELVTRDYLEKQMGRSLERGRLPDYAPFLDDAGLQNWLALQNSAQFPVGAQLTAFLHQSLPYLAEHFVPQLSLVSIGVGDGRKDAVLLESLMRIGTPRYYCIDVSSTMIDAALNRVAHLSVEKTGLVAFLDDLAIVKRLWCPPVLLCLLGNTLSTHDAGRVVAMVRAELGPLDLFLFDCCLRTPDGIDLADMCAAPACVRFQTAPLVARGLDPESVEFVVRAVSVETPFGLVRRVDRTLEILRESVVVFKTGSVSLFPGDTVQMGRTWHYTLDQVRRIVELNRLVIVEQHIGHDRQQGLFLLRRPVQKNNLV